MSMEKYIVIQSFMIQDLKLKGNELIVYAILYGFSQDGKTAFNGSLSYISDWIGCTKRQAINILQSLEKKELISKKQFKENNVLQNLYYCRIKGGGEKISLPGEKISLRGSEKISLLPIFNNNNNNNNNKSKVDLDKKEEEYFFAEAEKNSMWREQVCMNLKIDDFEKEFAEFRKDCIMLASQHNSEQDVQRHFLFWYRKKKREDKERSKIINNNNSLTKTAEQW